MVYVRFNGSSYRRRRRRRRRSALVSHELPAGALLSQSLNAHFSFGFVCLR